MDFLENPTKHLVPESERTSMKTPQIMVKDDDWEEVAAGLIRRGICEPIPLDEVLHVHGHGPEAHQSQLWRFVNSAHGHFARGLRSEAS